MAKADSTKQLNWHVVLGYAGVIVLSLGAWGAIIRAAGSLIK
jgi:hypothetical protein